MSLVPVDEALARICASAPLTEAERVALADAGGRTLAADLVALRTQPPFPASAMDGYAVRAADVAAPPARLRVIGESAAGRRFAGAVGPGEAVRIFTGAPVPMGADAILIQENTTRDGPDVVAQTSVSTGRFVRVAGLDFEAGTMGLRMGRRLDPAALALAAAMGHAELLVARRPRVAILATGDELVPPGAVTGPDQIMASNTRAVAMIAQAAGAETLDLGIARDDLESLRDALHRADAAQADILVTLGGASVGEHDLVRTAFETEGLELGLWRIAMRPGKPLMHGRVGPRGMVLLGLPGNPVSALVCAHVFLYPLVRRSCGAPEPLRDRLEWGRVGCALPENDERQDYLRAELHVGTEGPVVTPFTVQDSSMLSLLARADALLIRAPHAPAAAVGDACRFLRLR